MFVKVNCDDVYVNISNAQNLSVEDGFIVVDYGEYTYSIGKFTSDMDATAILSKIMNAFENGERIYVIWNDFPDEEGDDSE